MEVAATATPAKTSDPRTSGAWGANARCGTLMQPLRPGEEVDGETTPARRATPPALAAAAAARRVQLADGTLRPARARCPSGHHRAGGQRRHRQDVHARRAGDPLRRRGRATARPDAAHHLRPGGQPGAARAGARAARSRPQRALGDPGRSPAPTTLVAPPRRRATDERARARRRSGCATRWPTSTPRPSPPPTSSASWCCESLGVAGDTDSGVTLVESLDDLVTEVVDDLYLAHFGQPARRPGAELPPTRSSWRASVGRRPRNAAAAARPAAGLDAPRCRVGFAEARPRRARDGASAASASSATTTC